MSKQNSIKETVYNLIVEDILAFEFRPNDILNEKALTVKYGYSKTSVREALLTLCDEHVLRCLPRYGYEVIRITSEDICDMLQARYILERGILTSSHTSFNDEQLKRLEEIDADCTAADTNIWEHWHQNSRFHIKMISYCGNCYAEEIIRKTMDRLKHAYAQLYWNSRNSVSLALDTTFHKEIIDSLRRKDIKSLQEYLYKDLCMFGGRNFFDSIPVEQ